MNIRVVLTFSALLALAVLVSGCASTYYDDLWALNKRVSHRFTYVSDMQKHGVIEYHEKGVTGNDKFSGDCEEYAFAIKYQLARAGINATVWHVYDGVGGHAVTCTEDGYCLDHKQAPRRREDTGYEFIKAL